jgi:hypothetical protein
MRADRLSFAVETGALVVPSDGRIAVFGPAAPQDVALFSRDRLQIVTRQKLDHDAFAALGYAVVADATPGATLALVASQGCDICAGCGSGCLPCACGRAGPGRPKDGWHRHADPDDARARRGRRSGGQGAWAVYRYHMRGGCRRLGRHAKRNRRRLCHPARCLFGGWA